MDNFDHVIVDGYNILKKWNYFKNIDDRSLEYKRMLLTHILQSFSDFTDKDLTIVFDGSDNKESLEKNGRVTVVFSKKNESADNVIERMVFKSETKEKILVATDDRVEQNVVFGMGAFFTNATSFEDSVNRVVKL